MILLYGHFYNGYLDAWQLFGVFNRNAKLHTAQKAAEPVIVVHAVVHNLNPANQCPRHSLHQLFCENPNCEQCRGQNIDLEDVDEVYGPVIFSRHIANQLPTEKLRQNDVAQRGLGNLYPDDIDWQKLHQNPRK